MSLTSAPDEVDTVVIGAGVVGLAIARALAQGSRETIILETENAIGTITSSRNSGVIHAGLYYKTGSLKARFCVEGRDRLYEYAAAHNIPHKRCGKLVVATEPDQIATLDRIRAQAELNGVTDLTFLTAAEAKALEPEVACVAALLSPSSGLIDQHILMHELLGDAQNAGAALALKSPVLRGAAEDNGRILLEVGGAQPTTLSARHVVNAAGLSAQAVARSIAGVPAATIPPQYLAKGNYFTVSGPAPFARLIYPVPIAGGLGAHGTTDFGGQARFGPDVEWVERADDYAVDPARAESFYRSIRRFWPKLRREQLQASYAGIRPKLARTGSADSDFVIQGADTHGVPGLINLYGIESPGLTSSMAIGDYVASLIKG